MGLFRRKQRAIDAVGTVVSFGLDETTSASNESSHQHHTRGSLTMHVLLPGAAPRSVTVHGRFPAQQFPSLGQELPLRVAIDDPDDITIVWDRVPSIVERMTILAEQAREAQRTGQAVGPVQPPSNQAPSA